MVDSKTRGGKVQDEPRKSYLLSQKAKRCVKNDGTIQRTQKPA